MHRLLLTQNHGDGCSRMEKLNRPKSFGRHGSQLVTSTYACLRLGSSHDCLTFYVEWPLSLGPSSAAACPGRTVAGAVQQGQSVDRTRRLRPSRRSFLFRFASSLLIVGPSFSEERHPAVSILRGGLELSLFRVLFIPDEAGRERRGAVEFL